jgi:hypothetical protein
MVSPVVFPKGGLGRDGEMPREVIGPEDPWERITLEIAQY